MAQAPDRPDTDDAIAIAAAELAWRAWEREPAASIELVSLSENTVFRVASAAGEPWVLRIHRPGYHDYEELLSEQVWTEALGEAGIDVPVPRKTRDGLGYARLEASDGRPVRYVSSSPWVDGIVLSALMEEAEEEVLVELFAQLGSIIATLHEQAVAYEVPAGFRRHAFDADGLMGDQPFWGPFWEHPVLTRSQRQLVLRARARIHDVLTAYGKAASVYSLIHADLHPGNVLRNGPRLHVIDFDDAGFGWHQYDLAVALFSYQSHPHFDAIRDALIVGYRTVRPLADETLELLPTFLLIRALVLLGWIHGRPELDRSEYLERVIELACSQSSRLLG